MWERSIQAWIQILVQAGSIFLVSLNALWYYLLMFYSILAEKHARFPCVTVSVDDITFDSTVSVGHVVILRAVVNRPFSSSLEVCRRQFHMSKHHCDEGLSQLAVAYRGYSCKNSCGLIEGVVYQLLCYRVFRVFATWKPRATCACVHFWLAWIQILSHAWVTLVFMLQRLCKK